MPSELIMESVNAEFIMESIDGTDVVLQVSNDDYPIIKCPLPTPDEASKLARREIATHLMAAYIAQDPQGASHCEVQALARCAVVAADALLKALQDS